MRKVLVATAMLLSLALSTQVFGQTPNATLSGTVQDASAARVPGVKISATNTRTNVKATTLSNNSGAYSFSSLQPGTYRVTAEMTGFQTYTYKDVQLGSAGQVRLNFTLEIAARAETVEVSVESERLILESSSSVGEVLNEKKIEALPLVNNNVLDLIKTMGGTTITNDAIYGANNTTFAGVGASNINIQRDGVTVNDVRWPTGVNAPTTMNPDLVGEFRMILSPVDAEVGRGSGQIQVLTKSGANTFHGNAVWNIQNSALDGNRWDYNRSGLTPPWRNQNEYSLSLGGPIIKDKTFFFALWDQQITRTRELRNSPVLTPCARKGIFRYFDGWNNGNRLAQTVIAGNNSTIPVVDISGNVLVPATNPDGSDFTGSLHYASVFGVVTNAAGKPTTWDCSDAIIGPAPTQTGTWDPYRTAVDSTGFITDFSGMMPPVNNYDIGDGLNVAGFRWNRGLQGADNLWGIGEPVNRKQINIKIDHNFNSSHRISGNYSFEKDKSDDMFMTWPNTWQGANLRQPQVLTVNLTSTLKPNLINEFRFGMSRQGTNVYTPLTAPQNQGSELAGLFPTINGTTVIIEPDRSLGFGVEATGNGGPSHFYGSRGIGPLLSRDNSPRWTYADTATWTRGRHSFKGGIEIRRQNSEMFTNGNWFAGNSLPSAIGGATGYTPILEINSTNMPGLAGTTSAGNRQRMMELLNYQAGSVGRLLQYRFVNSPTETDWNDPATDPYIIRNTIKNEFSLFVKDDWKVNDSLTLNLGMRYEWYGVPYVEGGMTSGWDGGGNSIFGISGRDFSGWWPTNPSVDYDPGLLTTALFVGPGSPNPDQKVYQNDSNNFGPAVGFAWQLPWFGRGKTTLRGGYQMTYIDAVGLGTATGYISMAQGTTYSNNFYGSSAIPYMSLATLAGSDVIPAPISTGITPGARAYPIDDRTQTGTAFDLNLRSPYIQTLTLSLTRNIGSNLTVDLRYTGTLSRKSVGTININSPNFLTNNFDGLGSLKDAFDAARSGGESALLDRIFNGINIVGNSVSCGVGSDCNGALQTGAGQMRRNTTLNTNLANGNYSAVAASLDTMNYNTSYPGNSGLPPIGPGSNGNILRYNGFPENYIRTNPQLATANLLTNLGHSNYHGFQAQVTYRGARGLSLQGTYTWSRNLGIPGTFTNPADIASDYQLLPSHRSHMFTTYGTWDLPFGPNGLLFKNSSGVLDRIASGWQISWIGNVTTGTPFSISAGTMLYANGVPDQVGPWNTKAGSVTWANGALSGDYFGGKYSRIADPQCGNVDASLQNLCTLQAVVDDSSGQIIFQNPLPGNRGNFGQMNMTGPANWSADMALGKAVRITEGKSFQFRVDVTNVFNHPQPGGNIGGSGTAIVYANPPLANINSTTNAFGEMTSKAGRRVWQAKLRFDF